MSITLYESYEYNTHMRYLHIWVLLANVPHLAAMSFYSLFFCLFVSLSIVLSFGKCSLPPLYNQHSKINSTLSLGAQLNLRICKWLNESMRQNFPLINRLTQGVTLVVLNTLCGRRELILMWFEMVNTEFHKQLFPWLD